METNCKLDQPNPKMPVPGPGRPKGSLGGRAKTLIALDNMLAKEQNLIILRKALQKHFEEDPISFFRQIVMPLMPRDVRLKLGGEEGVIQWASLLTTFPMQANASSTMPEITDSVPSVREDGSERPCALPENCSTADIMKAESTAGLRRPITLPNEALKRSERLPMD